MIRKSNAITEEIIKASQALIDFNISNKQENMNKSIMSIINAPTGETIVVVSGSCVSCLQSWFADHAQEVVDEFLTKEQVKSHESEN